MAVQRDHTNHALHEVERDVEPVWVLYALALLVGIGVGAALAYKAAKPLLDAAAW